MRIILASGSPRRIELLRTLGVDFEVRAADIDERAIELAHVGDSPERIALAVAHGKLEGIQTDPDDLVIAADTVVTMDRVNYGKPADPAAAITMLNSLAGREHRVTTAIVFRLNGTCFERAMRSYVVMHELDADTIARYAECGEPLDKAGGYAVQGSGAELVKSVQGCFLTVVGFPLCAVLELLEEAQILCPIDPVDICHEAAVSRMSTYCHLVPGHPSRIHATNI